MSSARLLLPILIASSVILTPSVSGASFVVPEDADLISRARSIMSGTIVDKRVEQSPDGSIETIYRLQVDEWLKGSGESIVEFREWGGVLGDRWMAVSGTPRYEVGHRYLVFFDTFRDGRLTTMELALGKFEFQKLNGEVVLLRDLEEAHLIGEHAPPVRPASEFMERIRSLAAIHRAAEPQSLVLAPRANDLDTRAAASKGASQWSSGSAVNYVISGAPASGSTKGNDPEERIIVDDPNQDIAGSFGGSGTIAVAFFGGTTGGFVDRVSLTYSDIVVQDGVSTATGVSQEEYATVLTHELGHTLGFRHSNQNELSQSGSSCQAPLPCSTSAVMNSFVVSGLNGTLQSWDKAALQANYGGSPNADYLIRESSSLRPWYRTNPVVQWRLWEVDACNGPVITSGPVAFPSAVEKGQPAQLSVSAVASQGALQFQWYRGSSGNTSNPVAGGTSNAVTVTPDQTTSYWVRIADGCGSTNSPTVQVSVSVCEPVITLQPQNRIIGPGETTTLSVAAANATSYNWYVGSPGNTSVFAGSGPSLTVSPPQTRSYWVRALNSCGFADSIAATVQVLQCPPPAIVGEPSDVDVQSGEKATFQVVTEGTVLGYEWYLGQSGDTSTPIGEDADVLVLENVTGEVTAWVRVHGECGFRDSRAARARIVTVCVVPQILVQPEDASIPRGSSARLAVEATGTSLIYQWTRRASATSLDVAGATGPTLQTEPLDGDRIYFVRVRNACGAVSSSDARVTVTDCVAPRIVGEQAPSTQGLGATATLQVSVEGTGPFEYQWFEGQRGDTSLPIVGARDSMLVVGPLSGTVSYWVRVVGACGTVDSSTMTVMVDSVRGRPVRRP